MLLRVKEETGGRSPVSCAPSRAAMQVPAGAPRVDVDWSSYAGKRRQLPWFLLATLILARNGWRVFMHGAEGHTDGRVYTREALAYARRSPSRQDLDEAAAQLSTRRLRLLALETMSPKLADMMGLRPILGLRSPVHTFARLLNPFAAPTSYRRSFIPAT